MEYLTLPQSKEKIPQLGFGTAGIGRHAKTVSVVKDAIDSGFRRFDTASMYENEMAIGEAIRQSDIDRDEIFVTTKLWNGGRFGYEETLEEATKSIDRLGLDYIDLYLHHWPAEKRLESWKAMEILCQDNVCRYIGVSNYTITHLDELNDHAEIKPVLNQVEFNPFLYQQELLQYSKTNRIILEAYSPFAQGKRFQNTTLLAMSEKYDKSVAQIMLRWAIQLGISAIPKSSSLEHTIENIDIFDFNLGDTDMATISELHEDLRLEWDPTGVV